MARSVKKGIYVHPDLLDKVRLAIENDSKEPIKTKSRNSCIISSFIGKTFLVHNGNGFIPVHISSKEYVGHKLGEFAFTRKFKKHSGDKQAQRRIS